MDSFVNKLLDLDVGLSCFLWNKDLQVDAVKETNLPDKQTKSAQSTQETNVSDGQTRQTQPL